MKDIPLYKIHTLKGSDYYVRQLIRSGTDWATGEYVTMFENAIKRFIGVEACATLNSGTSALQAALLACDIGPGDEVIVPSFTFIATANAVVAVGATPVFADIELSSYGLDIKDVEQKVSDKTKAIIPVHVGGKVCRDIDRICLLGQIQDIKVIEDAAEAMGAHKDGVFAGTWGDAGVFSFCGNKIISTGEGGAVISRNEDLIHKVKMIRSHGREERGNYFRSTEQMEYTRHGYNWRLSNLAAAVGLTQMENIDTVITMRKNRAALLSSYLRPRCDAVLPDCSTSDRHVYQMYTIEIEDRDGLQQHLKNYGISSKVYFQPVHQTKFYREFLYGHSDEKFKQYWKKSLEHPHGDVAFSRAVNLISLPVTEALSERVLSLPMYPDLTKEECRYIADCVGSFQRSELWLTPG